MARHPEHRRIFAAAHNAYGRRLTIQIGTGARTGLYLIGGVPFTSAEARKLAIEILKATDYSTGHPKP